MSADDKAAAAWDDYINQQQEEKIEQLERELNASNERIQSLIEERDRANRLAEWKWNLRDEFESLLGTDKIEEGIEAVKELKRHIKRLEEAGDALKAAGYFGGWADAVNKWVKVKEAKP